MHKNGDIGLLIATAGTLGYLAWMKWGGDNKSE
jgi:hypothetical protein